MTTSSEEMKMAIKLAEHGRADYSWYMTHCLDVRPEHLWSKMREVNDSVRDNERTVVGAGHGVSKAITIDTLIITAKGSMPISDIKLGDMVFDETGRLTEVIEVSPIQLLPCYEITFDDKSRVTAHNGHLWNVHDFLTRKRLRRKGIRDYRDAWDQTRTVTTEWIEGNLKHNGQNNVSIPLTQALKGTCDIKSSYNPGLWSGDEVDFPYTLGLWLGDGTRGTGKITIGDKDAQEIIGNIKNEGFKVVVVPSQTQGNCKCYNVRGLKAKLIEYGVLFDKHFLARLLFSSEETKVSLLRGYMDADGYKLYHGGSAALGTTDKRLYDSAISLIASLGVKVHTGIETRLYQGNPLVVYKLNFSPNFQPFGLARKKIRVSDKQRCRRTMRMIVNIEPTGVQPVKCISVRSRRNLYLCTEHLIPTHNTYGLARVALTFLNCYYPSTVITTAPSWNQVKDEMWREIRESHTSARIPLGGKPTSTMLDMQPETGVKWFAIGIATKPDTVTMEATRMQGHHNVHMLIVIDEAAGVLPEIWRAIEHIGGDFKRVVAIGNPVTAGGEFAAALKDLSWHQINISVKDTPNYKQGRIIIPGVYGREYEMRIRNRYGIDSDQYKVRVLGMISSRRAEGAYYGAKMSELRKKGRIGVVQHDPNYAVHIVRDPGYTSAFWFFQMIGSNVRFIRYYEDSGPGVEDCVRIFDVFKKECGYHWGQDFVPYDMSSNAHRVVTGQTAYETLQALGLNPTKLSLERTVQEGIDRTRKFLSSCWFDEELCKEGIEHLESYHEQKNKLMSTEDKPVFTGVPAKDGPEHGADAMRYASKAVLLVDSSSRMTAEESQEIWARHRRL